MTDILVTNDDGIGAPGLLALKKELESLGSLGSLLVVGPTEEKSWISKGITRFGKIIVKKVKLADNSEGYSVQGTPADGTLLGIFNFSRTFPKVVVSGINQGANAGNCFIYSSGTVGVAIEAAMVGIPAIASSLVVPQIVHQYKEEDFRSAARITKKLVQRILKFGLPAGVDLLILNIPANATEQTEIVVTEIAKIHYGCVFEESAQKNEFRFIKNFKSAKGANFTLKEGTDAHAVFVQHKISITPVNINFTGNLGLCKKWMDLEL